MMPIATGRKATTMRMVMFQKTTAGPDSHTKWSTGGMFLSAATRSDHAPWLVCGAPFFVCPFFVCDDPRTGDGDSPMGLSNWLSEDIELILVSLPDADIGHRQKIGSVREPRCWRKLTIRRRRCHSFLLLI